MNPQQDALEHLRVIRSLMEKAHVYRAISAPAALAGGCLATALSAWQLWHALKGPGMGVEGNTFVWQWLVLLLVVAILNTLLLLREARLRDQAFVSERMRTALRSLLGPLLVGGVVGTGLMLWLHNLAFGSMIWILCYGLALLATAGFSPRSLPRLGWAFVAAGLLLFVVWALNDEVRLLPSDEGPAALAMGLTFGLLHIGYAVAVFAGRQPEALKME